MATRRIPARRKLRNVRPRPAPHPDPPAQPPADPPAEPTDPFDDPLVEQLTGNILQFMSAANSQSVEVRAEVGRLLAEIRGKLPHGKFRPYLEAHVPFNGSTAERAMNLHRFAEKQPVLFDKLKPLGVSKANAIIKLPVAKIQTLVASAHHVPSSGAHKTLLAMTYGEMMEVVTDRKPHDEHDELLRDYRRAARRLIRTLDALQDEHHHFTPADVSDPFDELELNLSMFAATFDLPAS